MQSRFVNEYRFTQGGAIYGDYEFAGDNGIKGKGETTKLTFEDSKLKTSGEVLMENGVSSFEIKKNENGYDRCVVACGDASMTMHRGALYDATIFTGPVTMEGSLEVGELSQPVNVLGNLHIAGQVTAGNLVVNSEILPSDVAFDTVQVDQMITAAVATITQSMHVPEVQATTKVTTPVLHATTEVNTQKVTADNSVHTKELTGIEKIAVGVGAVGGILQIMDHVSMPAIFTNKWIPYPTFPNPNDYKIMFKPETLALELAGAEMVLHSGDGFIDINNNNIKNVTEIHGSNSAHIKFPHGVETSELRSDSYKTAGDAPFLSVTGGQFDSATISMPTTVEGGLTVTQDATIQGKLTVDGIEGLDAGLAIFSSVHVNKISAIVNTNPNPPPTAFNFYNFEEVKCGEKVSATLGDFTTASAPTLEVNSIISKAYLMPLLFDGFFEIDFNNLPMKGYPPLWDQVGAGGDQFPIVDNTYQIPKDIKVVSQVECANVKTNEITGDGSHFLFDGMTAIDFGDLPVLGTAGFPSGGGGDQFAIVDNAYTIPLDVQMLSHTLYAYAVNCTHEFNAPTSKTQTIQMPAAGYIVGDKSDPAVTTELRFKDWDQLVVEAIQCVFEGELIADGYYSNGSFWTKGQMKCGEVACMADGGYDGSITASSYILSEELLTAPALETNVIRKRGSAAADLIFEDYATIDFNHRPCKNYPPAWDDAAAGVPDDIVCTSVTTTAAVTAGSLYLNSSVANGNILSLVMIDFLGDNVLELGNDVDEVDFNESLLSHVHIKDAIVFKKQANGDPLAYIEYNAGDNQIRVLPRVETEGVRAQVLSIYYSDDNYAGVLEGRKDDSDTYPYIETLYSHGPRFTHDRMALHPSDAWTFPTTFSTNTTQLPQKDPRAKNALFETYATQPYWQQYDTVFLSSSFDQQLFSISANPHVPAGANDSLVVDDIFDANINIPLSLERTSCVYINKPTRFVPSGSHDEYPVPVAKSICEPNALTVRFGFTDQDKKWGDNFDPDYYTQGGIEGMDCNERGISFTVPQWTHDGGLVNKIREVLHLSKTKSTFGCALHNSYRCLDNFQNGMEPLMTIGTWDWKNKIDNINSDDNAKKLNVPQLVVAGNILAYKSHFQAVNYSLSHHCETDEERVWGDFEGRLVSYTGESGGNHNAVAITDWKSGHMQHALSTVKLCTVREDVNWAGIVVGLTADKDATEIHIHREMSHFQPYHGNRQTIEVVDRGDCMVYMVIPLSTEIPVDSIMLSGKYTKYVNAVQQQDEVIINCNPDYSFTISEHSDSLLARVALLEQIVAQLTQN